MKISFFQLNRAGLDAQVIRMYQQSNKVKGMIASLSRYIILEPIKVYPPINGIYTLADGINRVCAHLHKGILEFEAEIKE